jgi:hypothetical protein
LLALTITHISTSNLAMAVCVVNNHRNLIHVKASISQLIERIFRILTAGKDANSVLDFAYSHVFLLSFSTHKPAHMQNQLFGAFDYRFIFVIVS